MPKRTATLDLTLAPRDAAVPAYRWLAGALRDAILAGRLLPGTRLPASRELARQYGLARGTILMAFDQLRAEGYLRGRVGSGTYVNEVVPDALLHVPRRRKPSASLPPPSARPRTLSASAARTVALGGYSHTPLRAFRANRPALDLFPASLWAKIAGRRMRHSTTALLLDCDAMGWRPLRAAVAGYLTASRGVNCAPEQVAIVGGVQEALDLAARLLVNPGDRVCMEDPGYHGAAHVFQSHGATICPVPVDREGMTVPSAELRDVRLAYITPAHQFPLSVSMTLPRRLALLQWAQSTGAVLFEDDYDSEYRFAGRPLPALQGLDRHGVVLFAGSFSKVLFPSLRMGYLVLPPDLVDAAARLVSVTNRHAPLLDQAVLCDFITEGHFGRHIRRMREVYAERLGVLQEGAARQLAGLIELEGIEAGLQTTGWLCGGIDGDTAANAAAKRDVEVVPLGRYARRPMPRAGLQLGFAAVDPIEIRRGVRELAAALEHLRRPV
ncbi:MAG TPA: PLP-dependent aminotransferase family protein [Gemmatimonadales bacterium]|nr:PLP-dependent aminotransferase family protein [Gemmatimonadales bacterium]